MPLKQKKKNKNYNIIIISTRNPFDFPNKTILMINNAVVQCGLRGVIHFYPHYMDMDTQGKPERSDEPYSTFL